MQFVDQYDSKGHSDPDRDQPNQRIIHLTDGTDVKLERRDPYGFIHIVWNAGKPPGPLNGVFTTFDQATQVLKSYLSTLYKTEVSETKVEKAPPLQYKKPKQE